MTDESRSSQTPDAAKSVGEQAEAWESWETRLCLWSLGIGVGALAVLGTLVNIFLL